MSNDENVTNLFSVVQPTEEPSAQPKTFEFFFKDADKTRVVAEGFPAFNGMIYALLDTPEDADTVNFVALAADVLYVIESDEVFENDE